MIGARRIAVVAAALGASLALAGASRPLVTPPPTPRPLASADTLFADDFSQGAARWTFDQPVMWSIRFGALCADLPDQKQVR